MAIIGHQFPLVFGLAEAVTKREDGESQSLGSVACVTPRFYAKVIDELLKNEDLARVIGRIKKKNLRKAWNDAGLATVYIRFPKDEVVLVPYIQHILDGGVAVAIPIPLEGATDSQRDAVLKRIIGEEMVHYRSGEIVILVKLDFILDLPD